MELSGADLAPLMEKPRLLDDPFAAIRAHLDDASSHVEEVYALDKDGAFADKSNQPAVKVVKAQLAKGAAPLCDLAYTAWVESGKPPAPGSAANNPVSRANPLDNPSTGSAAPGPDVKMKR